MRIAIAGSGALGSGFGYHLHEAGHKVTLLDNWEEHIQTVQTKGLNITVNGVEDTTKIQMCKPNELKEIMDTVFVFTKSMGLESMMKEIEHIIGPDTKVVCLLNGLGHAKTLEKYIDKENIIMGTTVWTAGIDAPGVTHFNGAGPVELQESDPQAKASALEVVDILQDAGLNGVYSEDVHFTTWRKACVNGTMNSLSTILDATIGEVFSSSTIDSMLYGIIREFAAVAELEDNIHLDVDETIHYLKDISKNVSSHYPSMHQDFSSKRPTEIDFLNGAVVKMSQAHGIEAPYCLAITDLIHAKEDLAGIVR